MDNFAWVNELSGRLQEQGHSRLAHLIQDVPYQKYLGNHGLVEALVPEALAAARALEIPWLEVYFKHWLCATRIGMLQGEVLLNEVVTAYEEAHQEKTLGCPQSVCVTQDLVCTYANVDGPGWAPERLAACDEALARIDASWGCFGCLSIERANAMADQGQRHEAVLYLHAQRDVQLQAGEKVNTIFITTEVEQWLALGKPQQALDVLDASEAASDHDDPDEQSIRLMQRIRALVGLGQVQQGWALLPAFDDIDVPSYVQWSRAAVAAAQASPELNTPMLGHALWTVLEHLHAMGSHRLLVDLALVHSALARARGVPWMAQQALAMAAEHVPLLHADLGAAQQVQAARQLLTQAAELPCLPAELGAWLQSEQADGLDNERVIEWLMQACQQRPDDLELMMTLATALDNFGAQSLARDTLRDVVQAHPESAGLQNQWFRMILSAQDMPAIEQQARRIEAHQPSLAAWYRARAAFHEQRYAEVGPWVQQVLELDADATSTRSLWAEAAMQLKDFDTAVEQHRLILSEQQSPEPSERWELLIAATAAGQWALVREQAQALGMELEATEDPHSPVEEDWGWVYLRIEEDGREIDLLARRTGPATARIVQPARRGGTQRLEDRVLIKAQLAEEPPEDAEALENYVRVFKAPIHTLQKGGFGPSYMIDGVHPGDEAVEALRNGLHELGCRIWHYSGDSYRVTDPDASEAGEAEGAAGLPGLYLAATAPAGVSDEVLAERVAVLCKGHALCWLDLARAAGHATDWHEAMQERYGL